MYHDYIDRTRLEKKMAEKIFDYDLKAHLDLLEAHDLKGNDFYPIGLKDVNEDFVGELLFKYLQDLKNRMKMQSLSNQTTSIILRKCVKLTDLDRVIDDTMKKCDDLKITADKLSVNLKKQMKLNSIKDNITRITNKKLQCDPYKTLKRRKSWKGPQTPFLTGFEFEEWDEKVQGGGLMRP